MTARCGSIDPQHVARRCLKCKSIYGYRYRQGGPLFERRYANAATCVFCGLAAGNSLDVKVLRYPLIRHRRGREGSVCIGSMGMCDDCVMKHATLNERTLQGSRAA